jgi:glycine oxidase
MLIGATVEDVGFDKRTVPETIQKLNRAAIDLVPDLAEARFLEAWAGLRPGTPDKLPILGATAIDGYFVATGHFRDGILLAPITAKIMAQIITGQQPSIDVSKFSAARFATSAGAESKLAAS